MAKNKEVEEVAEVKEQPKQFRVYPKIKAQGYSADIEGKKFVVTPQITGLTFDPLTNSRTMGIITKSMCYEYDLINGVINPESVKIFDGYFEDCNKEQERLLRIAGVIE